MGRFRVLWMSVTLCLVLGGCASLQANLDTAGLRDLSRSMLKDGGTANAKELALAPDPSPLADRSTFPLENVTRGELALWRLTGASAQGLAQERLAFPATLPANDRAIFHYYHRGNPAGRRVILFVPGYGVSDFAFTSLSRLFASAIQRDYDVLFYILPYHLERAVEGAAPGEGLLHVDPARNLQTILVCLKELRTGVSWVREQGSILSGGWGDSIGASLLYLLSGTERIDHMALITPIVDWNTLVLRPELSAVTARLSAAGVSEGLEREFYTAMSPIRRPTLTDPSRILLLYGQLDQFSPPASVEDFARTQGITDMHEYPESHSTILLNQEVLKDYDAFLARM